MLSLMSVSVGNCRSGSSYTLLGHSVSITCFSWAKKGAYVVAGTGGGGGGRGDDVDGDDDGGGADCDDVEGGVLGGGRGRGQLCLDLQVFICSIASSTVISAPSAASLDCPFRHLPFSSKWLGTGPGTGASTSDCTF